MQSNNFTVFHYKEIDSTQKEIWRRVKNQTIKDKTMIIADIQTAGIGTHGRTWHTDEENNIAFSIYLEANCKIEDIANLTINIAKNIVKTFKEMYDINLDIKYPNDIYHNGKKIGGILTETKVQKGIVKCIVIGIGINTNQTSFAKEIEKIATSIKNEFGITVKNEDVIPHLGTEIFRGIPIWGRSFLGELD